MWTFTKILIAGAISLCWVQSLTPGAGGTSNGAPAVPRAQAAPATPTSQPVITVHEVCDEGKQRAASDANACTTVVTREQFEILVKALNPAGQPVPANGPKNLAKTYADYLAIEASARKAGMEDTPEFHELMNWARLKAIADLYRRTLQKKYDAPSQEQIDAYYKEHTEEFERVKLARVLVPRESASASGKDEFEKKAHEVANHAQTSLAKGADPLEVQNDAYVALGLSAPPNPDLGERRRADFIPEETGQIFSLKPGEVSQVQAEPRNYVIYKVLGKDMVPEKVANRDISQEVYEQNFKSAMKSTLDAAPAEYDEEYLMPGKGAGNSKSAVVPSPSSAH